MCGRTSPRPAAGSAPRIPRNSANACSTRRAWLCSRTSISAVAFRARASTCASRTRRRSRRSKPACSAWRTSSGKTPEKPHDLAAERHRGRGHRARREIPFRRGAHRRPPGAEPAGRTPRSGGVARRGLPARGAGRDGSPLRAARAGRDLPLALRGKGRDLPALLLRRRGIGPGGREGAGQGDRAAALAYARGARSSQERAPLAAGRKVRRRFPRWAALRAGHFFAGARVRLVVGMSGGVASSVAALLLKRAGHEVVGLFMKNWEDDDTDEYCSTREDLIDAAAAADVIGIELEAVNFSAEYKDRVFAEFLREYAAGRTPNPDVLCNAEIKFKAFLDHAMRLGASRIATGHYARLQNKDGKLDLLRGSDAGKDQSYFLHRLNQEQLARVIFPVGEMKKSEVRRLALEAGLPNHAKKDSTGICFIGERPFRDFLNQYLPRVPGPIKTPEGKTVGEHIGLAFYTIGQRKGIGIGGAGEAWYVADKRMESNELVVVQGHDHPLLLKRELNATEPSWVAGVAPATTHFSANTRYRQADATCPLQ